MQNAGDEAQGRGMGCKGGCGDDGGMYGAGRRLLCRSDLPGSCGACPAYVRACQAKRVLATGTRRPARSLPGADMAEAVHNAQRLEHTGG